MSVWRRVASVAAALALVGVGAAPALADADDFVLDESQIPDDWTSAGTWVFVGSELVGSGMIMDSEAYQQRLVHAGFDSAVQQDYVTDDGFKSYVVLVFDDEDGTAELVEIALEEGFQPTDPLCGGPAWVKSLSGGRSFFTVHGAAVFVVETDTPGDADADPFISVLCPLMEEAQTATGDDATTTTMASTGTTSSSSGSDGGAFPTAVAAVLAALGLGGAAALFRLRKPSARRRPSKPGRPPQRKQPPRQASPPAPRGPNVIDETSQVVDEIPDEPDADQHERPVMVTLDLGTRRARPGGDTVAMTATARHEDWTPAQGRSVTFTAPAGMIVPPAGVSGPDGTVQATYSPGPARGEVRLAARCGASEGFAGLTVEEDQAAELELTVTPTRLRADGTSTADLTAQVYTDRLDPAVGVTVAFQSDGGGRLDPATQTTDQAGRARCVFAMPSGTDRKQIRLTASADGGVQATRVVRVEKRHLEVSADRERIPPGSDERVWLTATLTDDEGSPVVGADLEAEITGGGGRVYPERVATGTGGTAEISFIPGDRMETVTITVREAGAGGAEASVDIDQRAPHFEVAAGGGPVIRVLLTEAAAQRGLNIGPSDVVGVQVLDAAGSAWPGEPPSDAFLVAAFAADYGVRDGRVYAGMADGLDERAAAARRAAVRLADLAARGEKKIDQAAWWQAVHDDYYAPLERAALAIAALAGLYLTASAAVAKAGAVLTAKIASLGPAQAISSSVMMKLKAQAALAGAAEFIALPTLRELGEKVVVDGLQWVKGTLVTDFDAVRQQHGVLMTQATIQESLAGATGKAAETWRKVGPNGGSAAHVRSLLAFGAVSVTAAVHQADLEMRSAERDRLVAFGAGPSDMARFDEDERRRDEAWEECRSAARVTEQFAADLEHRWRAVRSNRGGI